MDAYPRPLFLFHLTGRLAQPDPRLTPSRREPKRRAPAIEHINVIALPAKRIELRQRRRFCRARPGRCSIPRSRSQLFRLPEASSSATSGMVFLGGSCQKCSRCASGPSCGSICHRPVYGCSSRKVRVRLKQRAHSGCHIVRAGASLLRVELVLCRPSIQLRSPAPQAFTGKAPVGKTRRADSPGSLA